MQILFHYDASRALRREITIILPRQFFAKQLHLSNQLRLNHGVVDIAESLDSNVW